MDEHTRPEFSRSALLTIDLQRDFLDVPGTPRGAPGRAAADRGVPRGGAAGRARRAALPARRQQRRPRRASPARGAVPGTAGSQLADDLGGQLDHEALLAGQFQEFGPGEHAMYKPRWSAFYGTRLREHLRATGVTTVVVAGCNYPNCPRSTLVDATERDFRTVAVRDAISGWAAAADRELAGMGIACLPAADVLAGLGES